MEKISDHELVTLIQAVFPHFQGDKKLGILVDIPRLAESDHSSWHQRRLIAQEWYDAIKTKTAEMNLEEISLIAYADVGSNNADLPGVAFLIPGTLPQIAADLATAGQEVAFSDIFKQYQLFLAPTQYSTTAPLKNAAKQYQFRAATMPGFSPEMLPALRIDYNEVARRVSILKEKLDAAQSATVLFKVDKKETYNMFFDLRFRTSHLSSGRFPEAGTAGNLPSGETYIVPYEGEHGEKSRTEGTLPVQIGQDVVFYTIQENRAISVAGEGAAATAEQEHLNQEPAYGNMAELGFGVLGDFRISPINEILLDEKLGFHVAFGRSDHFGGAVGPKDFSSPQAVIHLDRIYIRATQPRVIVNCLMLTYENGSQEQIIGNGFYLVF